jgi:acetyl-CoA C-acetyltransferase
MSSEAYIFDAIRTPRGRGKPNGALHSVTPLKLVETLLRELKNRFPESADQADEFVLGCCEQFNDQGGNLARSSLLAADYHERIPGLMVSRFCGSSLDAVNAAAAKIMANQADLVIAGGVEMLSLFRIFGSGGPLVSDLPFRDKTRQIPQGLAADLIATRQGYTRTDVDEIGARSQQYAERASRLGWFKQSLVPVRTPEGLVAKDELIRENVTVASLSKLAPAIAVAGERDGHVQIVRFRYPEVTALNYVHHAGNSSGIADGAGVVLIGNRAVAERFGWKPKAQILATASAGDDPCIMLTAPAEATRRALRRAGLTFSEIDLFEVNEAFASVVLYFVEKTGVPLERVNVVGGSIAMGHPVGATGAILIGTLVDELQRRGGFRGVATMCTGLGMGVATVVETM